MEESLGRDQVLENEFRAFVLGEKSDLYRFAYALCGEVWLAEDLVQTAFERTFARWRRLRTEDPGAYARRIIANANVDRWRRVRGREFLTDRPPERVGGDPAASIAGQDALLRALADLSGRERRVIVLRFLMDMSEAETARTLNLPLGTVKSATHRAVGKLRSSPHLPASDEVIP